ncbi:DUF6099 family protein [Kitasatospora cheerisanensis]|uniref:Uncharacterized protein n=1 Tax=Kitasatospora cheerisanensis KCTC 2395 TaxID=1348663 RepID=A0A066YVJ0_9ACTN|nr:DUF6099 family protein [Kitasatospora cheerisanensis]KDN85563.1 hypothetical protein KCH_27940 [Kitasatospora cheerisanensis KCTC 2395]
MEALRLIKAVRHDLAEARATADILHGARQSGLVTEAVGARIADLEGEEFATLGQLLSEAGAHTASCLRQTGRADPDGPGPAPAPVGRLTELGELEPVLVELAGLLEEAGENLVVLACGADTESLYWSCIDGLDANSECRDLVAELLREQRLATGDGTSPDGAETAVGPAGSGAVPGGGAVPEGGAPPGGARRGEPRLVVPLGPPIPASCAQPRAEPSGPLRGSDSRRSESSPARSVLIEASSSCICSSSDLVVTGAPPVAVPGAGGSVQGSDMRGPLQLGGAV